MVIPEPHTGHTDSSSSAPVQVSFVYLVEPWTILMFIFSLAMAMCGNVTSPKDVCELKTEISLWLGCTEPLGTPRVMQLLEPKRWVWMSIAIFISYWCLRLLLSVLKFPFIHTCSVIVLDLIFSCFCNSAWKSWGNHPKSRWAKLNMQSHWVLVSWVNLALRIINCVSIFVSLQQAWQ